MALHFALIRHGQYEQISQAPSALQPYPLTDKGVATVRREAQAFRAWVEDQSITLNPKLHSSTLLRAWQTAAIFKDELNHLFTEIPTIEQSFALCERSVGAVANLTVDEIERILALDPRYDTPPVGWKSDSHYCLPFDGAESLMQAGQRANDYVRRACADQGEALTLFFGHGAAFRHAACHLNVINECDIRTLSMHYGHPVAFKIEDGTAHSRFGDWKQRSVKDAID